MTASSLAFSCGGFVGDVSWTWSYASAGTTSQRVGVGLIVLG